MNQPVSSRSPGLSYHTLHVWGMLLLLAGIAAQLICSCVLRLPRLTSSELLSAMQNPDTFAFATVAIALQALDTCSVPIWAFLLVTLANNQRSNLISPLLWALVSAALAEIPYNLLTGDAWIVSGSCNFAFGPGLCLIMLYFFRRYSERCTGNTATKAIVFLAALAWGELLHIHHSTFLVILTAVLWLTRHKPRLQVYLGVLTSAFCSLLSALCLVAPLAFWPIHLYNGEQGEEMHAGVCLWYPLAMLTAAFASRFLL